MADETNGNSHASSHLTGQGTAHPTAPSPNRGHNENDVSAIPPNALSSQPRPDSASPTDPTAKATSQPMTTDSSSSSIPSAQPSTAMDTAGPSPYGTRSRNRTGNSRPNYAEDREVDTEYEWSTTKKPHASVASLTSAQSQPVDSERSSGINTRRSSTTTSTAPASKLTNSTAAKDHIPGMSSFSLNPETAAPAPGPSRKRKAPGGHATSVVPHGADHTSTISVPRKQSHVLSTTNLRETNMMSFEDTQAYLKSGKLRADDGTILEINGTPNVARYSRTS